MQGLVGTCTLTMKCSVVAPSSLSGLGFFRPVAGGGEASTPTSHLHRRRSVKLARRVPVIGAGNVGMGIAQTNLTRDLADEIALPDEAPASADRGSMPYTLGTRRRSCLARKYIAQVTRGSSDLPCFVTECGTHVCGRGGTGHICGTRTAGMSHRAPMTASKVRLSCISRRHFQHISTYGPGLLVIDLKSMAHLECLSPPLPTSTTHLPKSQIAPSSMVACDVDGPTAAAVDRGRRCRRAGRHAPRVWLSGGRWRRRAVDEVDGLRRANSVSTLSRSGRSLGIVQRPGVVVLS